MKCIIKSLSFIKQFFYQAIKLMKTDTFFEIYNFIVLYKLKTKVLEDYHHKYVIFNNYNDLKYI